MVEIAEGKMGKSTVHMPQSAERTTCFHCGTPCDVLVFKRDDKAFCCNGCLTVHDLLTESGLGHFYDLGKNPGIRFGKPETRKSWTFLDEPETARKLIDFQDAKLTRVRF